MKNRKSVFLSVLSLFTLCSIAVSLQTSFAQSAEPSPTERYRSAIQDAALAEPAEVSDGLIRIAPDNEFLVWSEDKSKVLVVTWKTRDVFEKYIKTASNSQLNEDRLIWVTAAPQVRAFCRAYMGEHPGATEEELKLRLQEYLGLDPAWSYDLFVELWVSPQDLFRPCVDPEITDSRCNLEFGPVTPVVKGVTENSGIRDYRFFFENLYYKSIRPGLQPWTGLGYTYDWGNPSSRVGGSEFILAPGAAYTVREAIPTMEYCKP